MTFDVRIAPRVIDEDLPALPGEVIDDLLGDAEDPDDEGKVAVLAEDPRIGKPLTGALKGLWRIPLCGRYRAVYSIFQDLHMVGVLMVGIRREATRNDVYIQLRALLGKRTVEQITGLTNTSGRRTGPTVSPKPGRRGA